jgi:hypothetical protein
MTSTAGRPQTYSLSNLLAPVSTSTHAIKFSLTITGAAAALSIPWSGLQQYIGAWKAQAMTVDNTAGSTALVVGETSFGWSRIIPPGAWQTFQFPAVDSPTFTFSSSGNLSPVVSFYDWPAFPDGYSNPAIAGGSSVTITGQPIEVTMEGTLPPPASATAIAPAASAVATGGVAVTAIAAGAIVNGAVVRCPNAAANPIWVNAVSAATVGTESGANFELLPGQSYQFGPLAGAISVNCSAAQSFVAFSW